TDIWYGNHYLANISEAIRQVVGISMPKMVERSDYLDGIVSDVWKRKNRFAAQIC
ncbi:Hypothetical protein FKW44_018703, partial [Caligus rogercresseyi]